MSVRVDHRLVRAERDALVAAYPRATGHLAVFLHGLVDTERSWFPRRRNRTGTSFGGLLADDLGYSAVYLRYNSGRHISESGTELAELLCALDEKWPVDITEIVLIGHSMGGLVARSALHQAHAARRPWSEKATRLVCLGTPHSGAPLERAVVRVITLLDALPLAVPLSRLLGLRSNGIKDLAHGHVHPPQPGIDRSATDTPATVLPPQTRQLFISATLSRSQGSRWGHILGDLLVRPSSSANRNHRADLRWLGGITHFALLRHPRVYHTIKTWLQEKAIHR
ncbi:triacylglycerol lipase [Allokutzneria sp. NRRL B-24872]|uniref:esterase/lipase family protein n=1 Tax=Allokutzneria sp. NRRL B-24872 TaxID=1137961 RepID=UPI000A3C2D20|nr:alpha/beta fold hydrolase [Allokutzneria sp. NRRL B-24872]